MPIYIIKYKPSTAPLVDPFQRYYREGFISIAISMPLDPANGSTMVVFCFGWLSPSICTIPT
jgi:hypothetical protein